MSLKVSSAGISPEIDPALLKKLAENTEYELTLSRLSPEAIEKLAEELKKNMNGTTSLLGSFLWFVAIFRKLKKK